MTKIKPKRTIRGLSVLGICLIGTVLLVDNSNITGQAIGRMMAGTSNTAQAVSCEGSRMVYHFRWYSKTLNQVIQQAQADYNVCRVTIFLFPGTYTGDINIPIDTEIVGYGNVTIEGKFSNFGRTLHLSGLTIHNESDMAISSLGSGAENYLYNIDISRAHHNAIHQVNGTFVANRVNIRQVTKAPHPWHAFIMRHINRQQDVDNRRNIVQWYMNTNESSAILLRNVTFDLDHISISETDSMALYITGSQSNGTIDGLTVEGSGRSNDPRNFGALSVASNEFDYLIHGAVTIAAGADVDIGGSLLNHNHIAAMVIKGSGTRVVADTLDIKSTHTSEQTGQLGMGLIVAAGASLTVNHSEIGDNQAIGVLVRDQGTAFTADHTDITNTKAQCDSDGSPEDCIPFGDGIVVIGGADISINNFEITGNARVGMYLFDPASSYFSSSLAMTGAPTLQTSGTDNVIVRNKIGLNLVADTATISNWLDAFGATQCTYNHGTVDGCYDVFQSLPTPDPSSALEEALEGLD